MKPSLVALKEQLLRVSRAENGVDIDILGEALTALDVSSAEIEIFMAEFEDAGGRVLAPEGGGNAERLKKVLASVRALTSVLGRRPSVAEIAEHAGLSVVHVRHALAVGSVMGR
ncbi:MAG: sigma-70 domain-containing protein [Polyangiaceae bacterium]